MVEQALDADFPQDAGEIRAQWEGLSAQHSYLEENAETRAAQFAAWTKWERKEGLAGLLSSLNPMYGTLYPIWVRNGSKHLVSPEDYELWKEREFPEPDW